MNYGRDYGNRNFLERTADRVRGWLGGRGGYDYDEYRGGMDRGWTEDRGYREMGGVGYRGGGMGPGYGETTWRGRDDEWNRGMGGGWGRGGRDEYRTGGYRPRHDAWDVDWDEGRGLGRGGMGRGYARDFGRGERDHYASRDFMTNRGYYDAEGPYRGDMDDLGPRGGMGRGMMGRGASGGWDRGLRGEVDRDWDRGERGEWNRGRGRGGRHRGGMVRGEPGMMGRDREVGDLRGGTIENYPPYGDFGMQEFRSGSAGGVPIGQYWRGYGVGSGYRG